jgi:protein-S-isoprenylcysteine O-methyltransferase Ste14
MQPDIHAYVIWTWGAMGVVWLAGALTAKRAVRTQSAGSRLRHAVLMVFAGALLFSPRAAVGPLAWRWLPDSRVAGWIGLALTVAGCAYAIWARLILAGNWSASVTVKRDHQLVRRGPYTVVRHPIYSGILLAAMGTAMVFGHLCGLAGLALAFFGFLEKSRLEEAFMTSQFGDEYVRYQQEVKALIPFLL